MAKPAELALFDDDPIFLGELKYRVRATRLQTLRRVNTDPLESWAPTSAQPRR